MVFSRRGRRGSVEPGAFDRRLTVRPADLKSSCWSSCLAVSWIRERSRTVQMQGGNDVDYPGVISRNCQRGRRAVIGRPAGRRGEDRKIRLFSNNAINSTYYKEH